MNKFLNPTFNFFTSGKLNRLSVKRLNNEWIHNKIKDETSKFIVLSNLKILVHEEPVLHAVFFSIKNLPEELTEGEKVIFLGEASGVNYFCLDVTGFPDANYFLGFGVFKELRSVAHFLDREVGAVLAYARAIINWHNNHQYCGVCGGPTFVAEAGHKRVCSNSECATEHFPRTDPAVIMLVEKNDNCLLARQAKWPQGQYSTIAGFVEPGESLEQAVQREVLEETGVYVEQIKYHSSQPWPFPAAIMLGFRATAVTENIKLGDHELEDANWFSRQDIVEQVKKGTLRFPPPISISFRLIQDWFDEDSPVGLEELIRFSK